MTDESITEIATAAFGPLIREAMGLLAEIEELTARTIYKLVNLK